MSSSTSSSASVPDKRGLKRLKATEQTDKRVAKRSAQCRISAGTTRAMRRGNVTTTLQYQYEDILPWIAEYISAHPGLPESVRRFFSDDDEWIRRLIDERGIWKDECAKINRFDRRSAWLLLMGFYGGRTTARDRAFIAAYKAMTSTYMAAHPLSSMHLDSLPAQLYVLRQAWQRRWKVLSSYFYWTECVYEMGGIVNCVYAAICKYRWVRNRSESRMEARLVERTWMELHPWVLLMHAAEWFPRWAADPEGCYTDVRIETWAEDDPRAPHHFFANDVTTGTWHLETASQSPHIEEVLDQVDRRVMHNDLRYKGAIYVLDWLVYEWRRRVSAPLPEIDFQSPSLTFPPIQLFGSFGSDEMLNFHIDLYTSPLGMAINALPTSVRFTCPLFGSVYALGSVDFMDVGDFGLTLTARFLPDFLIDDRRVYGHAIVAPVLRSAFPPTTKIGSIPPLLQIILEYVY